MWITSTRGHSIVTPALPGMNSERFLVFISILIAVITYKFEFFSSQKTWPGLSPQYLLQIGFTEKYKNYIPSVSSSVPRYDQPPPLPPPVTYQPRPAERNQPVLVPANPYHTAEIPDWLQVYARAPLKWVLITAATINLFCHQLVCKLFSRLTFWSRKCWQSVKSSNHLKANMRSFKYFLWICVYNHKEEN